MTKYYNKVKWDILKTNMATRYILGFARLPGKGHILYSLYYINEVRKTC